MRSLAVALLCLLVFAARASAQPPNIVFVLTDDLSENLVAYMPHVQDMERRGTSFSRYFVTDSLCCPSRSSIFTGLFPHSSGVITNGPPYGGFEAFQAHGDEEDTFATSLSAAGYRTGMLGKYLNRYEPRTGYVPPGWSAWSVAGDAYREFDYDLLDRTPDSAPALVHHGARPSDYLTGVLSRRGRAFMQAAVAAHQPFALEIATFAPHEPYTPAPRDASLFPGLRAPRDALFDAPQLAGSPAWLSTAPLGPKELDNIDSHFRKRAQSVQAVDRMIGSLEDELVRLGVANDTYLVFSSDNGFHMGERRMSEGKQTAWDQDIKVPLVVVGPGVPAGHVVDAVASNIDLRPTFQALAGAPVGANVEGRSLAPLLLGAPPPPGWRHVTLIEHHGPNFAPDDPDAQTPRQGNPPSYEALRFEDALYVSYDTAADAPEYYDLVTDPLERSNIYPSLAPARKRQLAAELAALRACTDGPTCHAADQAQ